MKTYPVTLVEIGLLSGTRATAAGGLALALAKYVPRDKRGAVGWTLLGVGSAFYIALVANVVRRDRAGSR
jgi:hypothetical protein